MRHLKPLHALALVAMTVSACGSVSSGQPGGSKHVSVTFVYSTAALNAMQEMAMGAKAAAQESPSVDFTAVAPSGAPATSAPDEANLLQAAARTSRGGIAYQTLAPDALIQALQRAHSSGIPLVAVDAAPPPSTGVDTFVGNSNFEVGQMLATEMLKRIPAGATGQVVVGNSFPGLSLLDQRVTGMLQVLRKQRPGAEIIGPFNSTGTADGNLAAWNAQVKKHPNALAYLAPSDLDAVSLAQIERQTGRHLLVGGCDLEAPALQAIKEGLVYALASPEHWLKGYIAVRLLVQHAQRGERLPQGWWNPGALVVDQSNVEAIIARQKDEASRTRWFTQTANKQFANQSQYVQPLSAAI
jgi:ABC-type sugar transport system substrate-binding protein